MNNLHHNQILPQKINAFETLALADHHHLAQPGNIYIPAEENVINAKQWVDENEK